MKAGKITAKLRDAVPVCFMAEGKEVKRYKNIDLPDELKELEVKDFGFDAPADGKITFRLIFDKGILPEIFPPARVKMTREEKRAAKAKAAASEKKNAAKPEKDTDKEVPAKDKKSTPATDKSNTTKVPQKGKEVAAPASK